MKKARTQSSNTYTCTSTCIIDHELLMTWPSVDEKADVTATAVCSAHNFFNIRYSFIPVHSPPSTSGKKETQEKQNGKKSSARAALTAAVVFMEQIVHPLICLCTISTPTCLSM